MIIQSRIEGQGLKSRSLQRGSLRAIGVWSVAILCGSLVAACSGTIETPTDEFPPREGGRSQAATDDDSPAPPRTPAATPSNNNPPVASNNDDEELPAAPADDEEETPAEETPADEPAAGALSFENDIQPIFNTTCGPCHAEQGLYGVSIGDPDIATAYESAVDLEARVLDRIGAGTMPPPCGGGAPGDPNCITEDDFADVEAWYEAGAPE
jgi:mono/diheme cytochrome c family protein